MPELAPVTKATFSLSLIFNLHHEKQMKPRMNTDVHSAAQPQPKKSTARTRRTRRKAISKTSRSSRLRGENILDRRTRICTLVVQMNTDKPGHHSRNQRISPRDSKSQENAQKSFANWQGVFK